LRYRLNNFTNHGVYRSCDIIVSKKNRGEIASRSEDSGIITFQKRYQSTPTRDGTPFIELTECELHVEQRYTADDQHYAIGNEKCAWKQNVNTYILFLLNN